MRDKLRKSYQVAKETSQNGYFEGVIPLADMERLAEFLYPEETANTDQVSVDFEFIQSEYDLPLVRGRLEALLALQCQRCLGKLDFPVSIDFKLLIDADEDTLKACSLDTLYSEDGYIDIVEVVEDELILGIPLVCMHEDSACNEHWLASEADAGVKENPFSVLEKLKTTN